MKRAGYAIEAKRTCVFLGRWMVSFHAESASRHFFRFIFSLELTEFHCDTWRTCVPNSKHFAHAGVSIIPLKNENQRLLCVQDWFIFTINRELRQQPALARRRFQLKDCGISFSCALIYSFSYFFPVSTIYDDLAVSNNDLFLVKSILLISKTELKRMNEWMNDCRA